MPRSRRFLACRKSIADVIGHRSNEVANASASFGMSQSGDCVCRRCTSDTGALVVASERYSGPLEPSRPAVLPLVRKQTTSAGMSSGRLKCKEGVKTRQHRACHSLRSLLGAVEGLQVRDEIFLDL